MNKLHLFLFPLFSTIAFSCSGMDMTTIAQGIVLTENTIAGLFNFANQRILGNIEKPETSATIFNNTLNKFNNKADILKKTIKFTDYSNKLANDGTRIRMIKDLSDFLHGLKAVAS